MRPHPAILAGLVLLGGACGGGSSGSTRPPTTSATTGATSATTFGGVVGASATQACLADAAAVQDASNAYIATHGQPAPSLEALVADGHLRSAPSTGHGYTIGYDASSGMVTASGACTFG